MRKKFKLISCLTEEIRIRDLNYLVLQQGGTHKGLDECIMSVQSFRELIFSAIEENEKAAENSNNFIFGFAVSRTITKFDGGPKACKTDYMSVEEFRKVMKRMQAHELSNISEITIFFDNATSITIYTLDPCVGHSHLEYSIDGVEALVNHELGKNWKRVFYNDYNGE